MTASDSYAPFIPEEDQGEKTIEPERETSKKEITMKNDFFLRAQPRVTLLEEAQREEIHRIAKGSGAGS